MVLANCVIVGLLGLSALALVRVERRGSQRRQELTTAQLLAWTGTELAVRELSQNPSWRTAHTHSVEIAARSFGGGTVSYKLLDLADSNLANNPADTVDVQGIGRYGDSVWVHQLQFPIQTVSPLDFALHAQGQLNIDANDQLTCLAGGISTNGVLDLDGTYLGAAECQWRIGNGGATGSVKERASEKAMPDSTVFASYQTLATTLPYVGDITHDVLSPAVNTYAGGLNTNGVYFINTGGAEITIRGTRILGTLVIQGHCRIDDTALLQPYRTDYPVLIVSGNLRLTTNSQTELLSESSEDTNFNPTGAAYSSVTDADKTDLYPNEVQGLVHVRGNLTLDETACVRGCTICEGTATVSGDDVELIYDATIRAAPPAGYNLLTYVLRPHVQRAQRVAAP